MNVFKTIETGLYTKKANDLMYAAHDDWSKFDMNARIRYLYFAYDPARSCDGESVFEIDDEDDVKPSVWKNLSKDQIRAWIGNYVKGMAKLAITRAESGSTPYMTALTAARMRVDGWKRNSDTAVEIGGSRFKVSELYCIYDQLSGNSSRLDEYDRKTFKNAVGFAADPVVTELEALRRERIEAVKQKYLDEARQLDNDAEDKIGKIDDQIRELRDDIDEIQRQLEREQEQLETKRNAEIKAVMDEFNKVIKSASKSAA